MKTVNLLMLLLGASLTASADASYTTTMKMSGGMMAGMMKDNVTKHFFKGNKMKMDRGDNVTILDFDAQTVTQIDNGKKTYTVTSFNDLNAQTAAAMKKSGTEIAIDVKETGQRKTINGFDTREVIMSMDIDNPQARQTGMKMRMEMDMWVSPDVPGAADMRAFYERNAGRFPWAALATGSNQGMQKGLSELQRKMATMHGMPVLQIMRLKPAGNEAQMAQAQQQMSKACAQMEEMKAKGGQQAAMAEQMLARMNCKSGGGTAGTMFESTIEWGGFSTSPVPESTFAIPAGYKEVDRK